MNESAKRRQLDFQSFDEILADVEKLHSGGYERLGSWNLAENLEHLRLTMESANTKKDLGVPAFMRPLIRMLFLNLILKRRQMKSGMQTAKGLLPVPPSEGEDETVREQREVRSFRETVERFLQHEGEYELNPLFGKLTREQWHELQKIHCSHHLSFLKPLR